MKVLMLLTGNLMGEGTISLVFSWIPWVYHFTMPCQMGSGVFPDVARVNNLAYMYHLDAKKKKCGVMHQSKNA
jgi:hypothetical protein